MDRGGAALALDRMVGGSIQRIRRGNLAQEQLRPDGGIPGPALLRGRGGPRGARCRARDHDGGHHLVRRHRPGGAARAHRRHPPVRARSAHAGARREPSRGPHRGAAAHGVGLRRRDRQPALVAARGERRARRPAREARLGRVAMLEKNYLWRVYSRGNEPIGARSHFRSPVVLQTAYETEDTWKAARVGPQYVVTVPIAADAKPLGLLHIGIDATFVDHVLFEVLLDVVVVLVVSL